MTARKMKDSGVEWIGEIPEEWGTTRFKFLHDGLNTGEAVDKEYWSSDANDLVFYTAGLEPIRTSYQDFPEWKFTRKNDLLLARNGTPYVYFPVCGACYTDHIIRAAMKADINRRYVQYSLQQSISSVVVDSVSLATWSASLWNEQIIAWPNAAEQRRIADYLDRKCAEIDRVVAETEKTIEEYKVLKQSIITEAVTKGVRGKRKMKDSGIEWIGEIPEEWKVVKIKTLFDYRNERNFKPLEDVNLISLYTDKGVVQHCDLEETTGNKASNADGYKIVHQNDIVVNIILCWMGAIGKSEFSGVTSPAYDVYAPKKNTNSDFYHYYFRTSGFSGDCFKYGRGIMAMRWRTYSDEFRAINVVCPSSSEQREIADYLDAKCAEIDRLVAAKQTLLAELATYKKSLIYEYVTGKKEVPECQ